MRYESGPFLATETERAAWLPPIVTIPSCVSLELHVDRFTASLRSGEHRNQDVDDDQIGYRSTDGKGYTHCVGTRVSDVTAFRPDKGSALVLINPTDTSLRWMRTTSKQLDPALYTVEF